MPSNTTESTVQQGVEGTPPEEEVQPDVEQEVTEEAPVPSQQATPQRPRQDPERELAWLRTQYQGTLNELSKVQKELREYEYAALDDDERGQREYQDRLRQLEEQEMRLQEEAYSQGLWQYYSSLVPSQAIQGSNPVEWQESVMTYFTTEIHRLRQENAALKKSAKPGATAPSVPRAGGNKPPKKSMYGMTWEEIEALREGAEYGLISGDDLPGPG